MEVIYFELNNWTRGRDYPDDEPFISWMGNDLKIKFNNEAWIKENKLVVVASCVDMSANFCITATRDWVENNCKELLTKHTQFIRKPDEYDDIPVGKWDCPFLEYTEENIGYHYASLEDINGYEQYIIKE